MQNLRKDEVEGLKIRARATWLNEGEKPSKYLTSLETKNYVDKTIRKLVRTDGSVLTDQKAILKEVRDFYASLFQRKQQIDDSFLADHYKSSKHFKKLSDEESSSLEHEITIEELSSALKHINKRRVPVNGHCVS